MATVIPINSTRNRGMTLRDRLVATYRGRYQPKDMVELHLVEELARNHWQQMVQGSMNPEPPDYSPDRAQTLRKAA